MVCIFKMKERQCSFSQDSRITVYIRLLLNMPYYILQIHKIKRVMQSHAKGVQYLPQTRGQKIAARLQSFRWTTTSAAISTQLFWKYWDSAALFTLAPTGTFANGPDTARSSSFSRLIQLLALSYYTFYSTGCWGLLQGTPSVWGRFEQIDHQPWDWGPQRVARLTHEIIPSVLSQT